MSLAFLADHVAAADHTRRLAEAEHARRVLLAARARHAGSQHVAPTAALTRKLQQAVAAFAAAALLALGAAGSTAAADETNIDVGVGNGGYAEASAEGGTVVIGDTSSGDIAVGIEVGDTTGGDAAGGGYWDYGWYYDADLGYWCYGWHFVPVPAEGGDASVDVSVGDISSAVTIEASADASAAASADGGDDNTVIIEIDK